MDDNKLFISLLLLFIFTAYFVDPIVNYINNRAESYSSPQVTNHQPTNAVYKNKNLKFKFYENGCFDAKLPNKFILRCV
jgi:hypothetical protein